MSSNNNLQENLTSLRNSYIRLLRDCLSHFLWIEPNEEKRNRFFGLDFNNCKGETMIGTMRLDNIYYCLKKIIEDRIEGDVIETGVWRGGAVIFMKGILKAFDITDKNVWVADSFKGVPAPDLVNYPSDSNLAWEKFNLLKVSKEEVINNFKKYNLLDNEVCFLEGWFKDTLPNAPIKKLSLIRLDGDLYESTYQALEALYPKLSTGGFCIIDDYSFPFCRKAVEDYRELNNIRDEIIQIDYCGVFWRKLDQ